MLSFNALSAMSFDAIKTPPMLFIPPSYETQGYGSSNGLNFDALLKSCLAGEKLPESLTAQIRDTAETGGFIEAPEYAESKTTEADSSEEETDEISREEPKDEPSTLAYLSAAKNAQSEAQILPESETALPADAAIALTGETAPADFAEANTAKTDGKMESKNSYSSKNDETKTAAVDNAKNSATDGAAVSHNAAETGASAFASVKEDGKNHSAAKQPVKTDIAAGEGVSTIAEGKNPSGIELTASSAVKVTVVDERSKKRPAEPAKKETDGKDAEIVPKKEKALENKQEPQVKSLREIYLEQRFTKRKPSSDMAGVTTDANGTGTPASNGANGANGAASLAGAEADISVKMKADGSFAVINPADVSGKDGANGGTGGASAVPFGGAASFDGAAVSSGLNGEIVRQASILLKDGGDGLIRLNLKPETLGNVKIRLSMEGGKISGEILVETKEALKAFENQVHEMERAFEAAGYDSARLSMSLANNGQGGAEQPQTWTTSGAFAASRYGASGGTANAVPENNEFFFPERELNVLI
ncbi:MAG: flagellar hook-length control protein FliK [Spirochaetaceae bacterium]|jgi:flagellar hook-length control protein FliK|nr:flagellar hook-length control protein FliK [Spirochaetaceae bacterium]